MAHPTQILAAATLLIIIIFGSAMGDDDQLPPYCDVILQQLTPCLPYIMENEAEPVRACCEGVKELGPYSKKNGGKASICACIKASAILLDRPVDIFSRVSLIPEACSLPVELPPISSDVDCSKVN